MYIMYNHISFLIFVSYFSWEMKTASNQSCTCNEENFLVIRTEMSYNSFVLFFTIHKICSLHIRVRYIQLQTRSIVFKSGGGGKLTRNLDSKKSYLNQKAKSTDLQIGGKGGG